MTCQQQNFRQKEMKGFLQWSYKRKKNIRFLRRSVNFRDTLHKYNYYNEIQSIFLLCFRYMLQFEVRRGLRARGDLAIDDVSMSPECFGLNVPDNETVGYDYDNFDGFVGN